MHELAFSAPPATLLRIQDSTQLFPVHRIYCVGRNFAEHAKEMGAEISKGAPVFFMKPADAAKQSTNIAYPPGTSDLHHEVELVLALGPDIPEKISLENAEQAIFAYAIGLDLTRRDLQAIAKEKRLPWDTAKGFDESAPLSELVRADAVLLNGDTQVQLLVNHVPRQQAPLSEMIFSCREIILELSKLFQLQAGDLIFMGTPAGVAALKRGDCIEAHLSGIMSFKAQII